MLRNCNEGNPKQQKWSTADAPLSHGFRSRRIATAAPGLGCISTKHFRLLQASHFSFLGFLQFQDRRRRPKMESSKNQTPLCSRWTLQNISKYRTSEFWLFGPIIFRYRFELVGGFNHLEKYEFVNREDYPIYCGKIKFMFQTTNQIYIITYIYMLPSGNLTYIAIENCHL